MSLFKTLLVSLPVLATAIPVCPAVPANFHLAARSGTGESYPLAAVFPAPFNQAGTQLHLYASTSSPYNISTTNVFKYDGAGKALTTTSPTRPNPNGSPVLFYTPAETAGQAVVLVNGGAVSSHFSFACAPGSGFFAYDSVIPAYALCNGDQIDQQLGRKLLYLQPKVDDASCVPVTLYPVAA